MEIVDEITSGFAFDKCGIAMNVDGSDNNESSWKDWTIHTPSWTLKAPATTRECQTLEGTGTGTEDDQRVGSGRRAWRVRVRRTTAGRAWKTAILDTKKMKLIFTP